MRHLRHLWCLIFHGPWHELAQEYPEGFADWIQVWLCHRCKRKWERIR